MKGLLTASGISIAPIGLGTYPLKGEAISIAVQQAVKSGYQLIDTADDYHNEDGIGIGIKEAIKNGSVKREEVFIQTKISDNCAYNNEPLGGVYFSHYSSFMKKHSVDEVVREKVNNSLLNLQTDYLDSVLLHYPFPDFYEEVWDVLRSLKKEGKVRYIGVSNFYKRHLEVLKASGEPAEINQVYLSPIGIKKEDVDYCNQEGIQLMTYSPLIDIRTGRLPIRSEIFTSLQNKYGKSVQQILIRWNIDRGSMPIVKSQNPNRMKDNLNVFDFSLTRDEVESVSSLNRDYQYLPTSRMCPGF